MKADEEKRVSNLSKSVFRDRTSEERVSETKTFQTHLSPTTALSLKTQPINFTFLPIELAFPITHLLTVLLSPILHASPIKESNEI